ncbi:type II secretion system minor pseudopilin GspK [bacterium]|nr:type II secretion system minor pseudopilin GspK [candidate division CSSED10-310 bacterium]
MKARGERGQRGAALIVTILLLGLITFLTAHMLYMSRQAISLAESRVLGVRLRIAADSAQSAMIRLLIDDDDRLDHLGEAWAEKRTYPNGGTVLEVTVTDLNALFDPNALLLPDGSISSTRLAQLERLLRLNGCGTVNLEGLLDWLDTDDSPRSRGAESGYHATGGFGAKNAALDTLGELMLVRDGRTILDCSVDLLTVFSDRLININTAGETVLMSLDDDFSAGLAHAVMQYRERTPFHDIVDLLEVPGMTADVYGKISRAVTVRSHYFAVEIHLRHGDLVMERRLVLRRRLEGVHILSWEQWER